LFARASPARRSSDLATTSTTLSSSLNPSTTVQAVTLTARVTSAAGVPTGTVTFKDGVNQIGLPVGLVNGVASISTTFTTAGTHPLTAVYSGDANFLASTSAVLSQVVNAPAPPPPPPL